MSLSKKLGAEFIGTFWLVLGGCGLAVLAAGYPELGIGFAGVALAFGLTVLTMVYAVGHISGGRRYVAILTYWYIVLFIIVLKNNRRKNFPIQPVKWNCYPNIVLWQNAALMKPPVMQSVGSNVNICKINWDLNLTE